MGKEHVHIGIIGNVSNSKSKQEETFKKLYRVIENKDIDIPKSKQEKVLEKINRVIESEDVKAIDDGER